MRLMKRWGVMTLVALLVLGTMGAALANEVEAEAAETEAEVAKEALEPGMYPALAWADGLLQFVFFWGYPDGDVGTDDGLDCPAPDSGEPSPIFGFGGAAQVTEVGDCVFLNVEKNGHVNHGSMVSAVVHWLKDGGMESLPEEYQDMPKGQLLKEFAHLDFGKGNFVLPDLEDTLETTDVEAEESDGHGPPVSVLEKKAAKAAAKANKGKNK